MADNEFKIVEFSNQTKNDRQLLKQFVDFHWSHYENDPQYVPLLDYEYLGFRLIGMTGFFEPRNLFFKHAEMRFFLAQRNGETVGRCNAFVNHSYNEHWNEKTGFWGQFESIDDLDVARALTDAAANWLAKQGMDTMRGPQNLPINEATPGLLTEGFDTRPVIYYQYNKPYYQSLIEQLDFKPAKKFLSWEAPVNQGEKPKLERVTEKIMKRFDIKVETWDQRPFKTRRQEMFEIYNDAWSDNYNFVPFTQEEFFSIVSDMMLVMDKKLFLFIYVNDEPAAFFGGVPNINEVIKPIREIKRWELIRAIKMLLTKQSVKGFRLGYLGVKKKFRRMGLDGLMLWKQHAYSKQAGYEYSDLGWVLEDNVMVHRLIDLIIAKPSKVYTIYEKQI